MNDCKQVVGQTEGASEGEGDTGARPEAAVRAAGRTGGVMIQGQIKANRRLDDTTRLEQTGNSSVIQLPGERTVKWDRWIQWLDDAGGSMRPKLHG